MNFHTLKSRAHLLVIFWTAFFTLLPCVISSHWINLHVWHDELELSDQQQLSTFGSSALALNSTRGGDENNRGILPDCHKLDGLTQGQVQLCLLFFDHMRPVIQGAKLGLSECRWQFRHHHWNCSILPTEEGSSSSPVVQSRVLRENKVVTVNSRSKNPSSRRKNGRSKKDSSSSTNGFTNKTTQSYTYDQKERIGNFDDDDTDASKLSPNKESRFSNPPSSSSAPPEYLVKNSPKLRERGKNKKNVRGIPQQQIQQYSSSSATVEFESPGQDSSNSFTLSSSPQMNDNKKTNQNRNQILHLQQQQQQHLKPHNREEKSDWNSVLTRGTKEVAFAQAIWSAAVTESVARSCREGSISSCGCGKTPRPSDLKAEWRWGGCGDNLQYGYKFAQSFVDIKEQENSPVDKKDKARSLVNLHNNEAGRRAVLKKTKIVCKCHGVSGSCALVTCWHQIPSFREIGDHLKERYQKATQVKLNKRGRLQVKKSGVPVPSVVDLVYIENSPNYCVQNETLGIYGTVGRVCNRTSTAPNSCKSMCCNRGYTTVVAKSDHRCNCKFIWCCQVVCEECRSVQKYDVCK